uniref:Uncharacterized protein n=1 Tax=viral metagenome TaxID=1070528 RepID=A0A6M3XSP0_9ZZZZ
MIDKLINLLLHPVSMIIIGMSISYGLYLLGLDKLSIGVALGVIVGTAINKIRGY